VGIDAQPDYVRSLPGRAAQLDGIAHFPSPERSEGRPTPVVIVHCRCDSGQSPFLCRRGLTTASATRPAALRGGLRRSPLAKGIALLDNIEKPHTRAAEVPRHHRGAPRLQRQGVSRDQPIPKDGREAQNCLAGQRQARRQALIQRSARSRLSSVVACWRRWEGHQSGRRRSDTVPVSSHPKGDNAFGPLFTVPEGRVNASVGQAPKSRVGAASAQRH